MVMKYKKDGAIMFLNAKNSTVSLEDGTMDYFSFGYGRDALIILPGLSDGLYTLKGKALPFSILYRAYAKNYKVYVFSRRNNLSIDSSTKDMARDQVDAMKVLGISKASIIGISLGGMIAQYIAIDYPDLLNKLILVTTLSRQNDIVNNTVTSWIEMAYAGNYENIIIDTLNKSYTKSFIKKRLLMYHLLVRLGRPKDFTRFIIQANSCLTHDAFNELKKIKCPTLIFAGGLDKVVGFDSSLELEKKINNCELYVYYNLGHALYEEANGFNSRVLYFLDYNIYA